MNLELSSPTALAWPSGCWTYLQVPEQLIGDVGLAGPKGEPGKKGPAPWGSVGLIYGEHSYGKLT